MSSATATVVARAARVSVWELRRHFCALGLALVVGVLAAANGGYFPTAWGWAAAPLAWAAGMALIVQARIRLHPLEIAFLAALGLLSAWIGLSLLWSRNVPQTVLELERVLVYLAGALAAALVVRRRQVPWLAGGLATAVALVCAYALATRLFPSAAGGDSVALNRLQAPIGYWNALGIFAVIGLLLLAGLATRGSWLPGCALAAAGTVVCTTTLYFTFSRGAWFALGVGILAALALDPRRLRLSVDLLVLAPFPAAAVLVASRSLALTGLNRPLAEATADGHRVAVVVCLLAIGAAGAVVVQLLDELLHMLDQNIEVANGSEHAREPTQLPLQIVDSGTRTEQCARAPGGDAEAMERLGVAPAHSALVRLEL